MRKCINDMRLSKKQSFVAYGLMHGFTLDKEIAMRRTPIEIHKGSQKYVVEERTVESLINKGVISTGSVTKKKPAKDSLYGGNAYMVYKLLCEPKFEPKFLREQWIVKR